MSDPLAALFCLVHYVLLLSGDQLLARIVLLCFWELHVVRVNLFHFFSLLSLLLLALEVFAVRPLDGALACKRVLPLWVLWVIMILVRFEIGFVTLVHRAVCLSADILIMVVLPVLETFTLVGTCWTFKQRILKALLGIFVFLNLPSDSLLFFLLLLKELLSGNSFGPASGFPLSVGLGLEVGVLFHADLAHAGVSECLLFLFSGRAFLLLCSLFFHKDFLVWHESGARAQI